MQNTPWGVWHHNINCIIIGIPPKNWLLEKQILQGQHFLISVHFLGVLQDLFPTPLSSRVCSGFLARRSPLLAQGVPTCLSSRWLPENASSDQIAGADPDYPDSTDPGGGAWDDSERVRCYTLILQRGRQHIPLQKCGKVTVYAHVGLPGTLWAGMFENGNVHDVSPP